MATQYIDGTFSETKPFKEAMKTFMEAVEVGSARSFHVGTPEQIKEIKNEKSNRDMIEELQEDIAKLKSDKESVIHIPTTQEVKKFTNDN